MYSHGELSVWVFMGNSFNSSLPALLLSSFPPLPPLSPLPSFLLAGPSFLCSLVKRFCWMDFYTGKDKHFFAGRTSQATRIHLDPGNEVGKLNFLRLHGHFTTRFMYLKGGQFMYEAAERVELIIK